jgi:RNA polymerase sigma-70 factor (ECF subfamily)
MSNPNKGKYEKINDEHLMKSIHHGDTGAFNELYGRYNRRLSYYFYRIGNSSEKHRTFSRYFIKIIGPELFDASRKFSTWVFSAHNMCKNEYRRMAVRGNLIREDNVDLYAGINETEMDMQLTVDQIL